MAVNTHDILAGIALRISALTGTQAGALNTSYTTRPLTTAEFQSAVFPFDACRDAVVYAEEQLSLAIANTPNHPFRSYIRSQTANLAHGAALPSTDSASKTIIGVWGSIKDSSDSRVCTEQPIEVIQRRRDNLGTRYRRQYYHYKLEGSHVYHTRTNVVIDCCFYDRATRKTAVINNTAILLSEALEPAYVSTALAHIVRDDEFAEQAAYWNQHSKDCLYIIRAGGVDVPPVSSPTGKALPVEG